MTEIWVIRNFFCPHKQHTVVKFGTSGLTAGITWHLCRWSAFHFSAEVSNQVLQKFTGALSLNMAEKGLWTICSLVGLKTPQVQIHSGWICHDSDFPRIFLSELHFILIWANEELLLVIMLGSLLWGQVRTAYCLSLTSRVSQVSGDGGFHGSGFHFSSFCPSRQIQ